MLFGSPHASFVRRIGTFIVAPFAFAGAAHAAGSDPMLIVDEDNLKVRMHFQAGVNAVAEGNLFWILSDIFAPVFEYDPDKEWIEYYVKPGVSFSRTLPDGVTGYGKASFVASYTQGTDAYDFSNTGRITLEEAYIGARKAFDESVELDVSIGPRELRLGTGMLIANGGSSGFERGALKFGPRKAWEMAAIGRLTHGRTKATAFYLDPNEMPSSDNKNKLAGFDLRFDAAKGGYIGGTYVHILESDNPYPQVLPGGGGAPTIVEGAREKLNAIGFYARTNPLENRFGASFVGVDAAVQWNDRTDMLAWAGRFQAGHAWTNATWSPSLTYTYKTYSGDDPNTARQERFDPLYYDGSPSTWATGSKSSMTFINSNVQAHELALSVNPTAQDKLTFRYAHIRANELRSPVQFGQATRVDVAGVDNVVTGVTDPYLADDFFVEYSRIINPNTFLTAGVSASVPGNGLSQAAGQGLPVWYGGFLNLVLNY